MGCSSMWMRGSRCERANLCIRSSLVLSIPNASAVTQFPSHTSFSLQPCLRPRSSAPFYAHRLSSPSRAPLDSVPSPRLFYSHCKPTTLSQPTLQRNALSLTCDHD